MLFAFLCCGLLATHAAHLDCTEGETCHNLADPVSLLQAANKASSVVVKAHMKDMTGDDAGHEWATTQDTSGRRRKKMTDNYCRVGDECWPFGDIPNLRDALSSPDALIDGTEAQQLISLQAWCEQGGNKSYVGGHFVPEIQPHVCAKIMARKEKFGVFWRSYTMNVVHYQTPGLIVEANLEQDVVAAFNFARKHNIRLAVRNTGHAYNSQSSANGGLVVLLKNFQNIQVNPDKNNPTITVGGGCTWGPVYQAANDAGYVSTGGHDPTVGVLGCTVGGCHGEFTRQYGYTASLVESMTVVIPGKKEAEVLEVDKDHHSELFWALRGGGPGFGAILKATIKIFPAPRAPVITQWVVRDRRGGDHFGAMCPQLKDKTPEEQEAWWKQKGTDGGAAQLKKWLWNPEWMESLPWGWSGWFTACTAKLVYCGENLERDLHSKAIKDLVAAAGPHAVIEQNGSWAKQVDYHLDNADTSNWIPQVFIGYAPAPEELGVNADATAEAFGSGLAEPLAPYDSVIQNNKSYTHYPVHKGRFTYYPNGYMDVVMMTHGGKANTPPPEGDSVGIMRRAAGWEYVLGYWTAASTEAKKYEMVDQMGKMIYPSVKATYVHEWVAQSKYNKFGMERFWDKKDIEKLEKIHEKYDPCNILWVARSIGHDKPHCAAVEELYWDD